MRAETVERLCCPLCHGPFRWSEIVRHGSEIRDAVVHCPSCGTRSEVRDGIGYFLPGDADLAAPAAPGSAEDRSGVAATEGTPPRDARWDRGFARTREFAVATLGRVDGPVLEMALETPLLTPSDRGTYLITDDPRQFVGLPAHGTARDGFVVDLHSLPFVNHAVGHALAGPALQEAPGVRVILRELHRLVRSQLLLLALVTAEGSPPPAEGGPFTEDGLLEEFRRAHWSARFVPIEDVGPPPSRTAGSPVTARWGVVLAE